MALKYYKILRAISDCYFDAFPLEIYAFTHKIHQFNITGTPQNAAPASIISVIAIIIAALSAFSLTFDFIFRTASANAQTPVCY
jgi:hypothetical protein